MTELAPEAPKQDWSDVVERYARELQIVANGEDDGFSADTIKFVETDVFKSDPQAAGGIYETLAVSPDPQLRLRAFERIPVLAKVDAGAATRIYFRFLMDQEVTALQQNQ